MADFISHFMVGELYLKQESDSYIKAAISENRQMFNWGAQGPDIFYFYKYMTKRRQPMVDIGKAMHKIDVNILLSAIQESILLQPDGDRAPLLSYLFGFMTHYHLDNRLHPYIAHLVQVEKQKGSRQTVSAIHVTKECEIGKTYYKISRKYAGFKHFSERKQFLMSNKDYKILERMWMPVFLNLFSHTLKPGVVRRCLRSCLFLSKLMFRGRFIVQKTLRIVGKCCNLNGIVKGEFKYEKDDFKLMNVANESWQHPKGETNMSVFGLFIAAAEDSRKTNELLLKALSRGDMYSAEFSGSFNYGFNTRKALS